jgi:seryl-tRNA synthetase
MLSAQLLRDHPDLVRRSGELRLTPQPVDAWLELDAEYRAVLREAEAARAEQRAVSKTIGATKDAEERARRIADAGALSDRVKALEAREREFESRRTALQLEFANLPDTSVPEGASDEDNVVVSQHGEPRALDFAPVPHWELGERLDIIDFERGVKMTGSRFYVLKGAGARLQRVLIQFMLDLHIDDQNYTELYPPFVVKQETLLGAGQLPKFADNLYHDVEDDIWLVPTAEVPITAMHAGEILDGARLPLNYVAYTPCFRREKMSAGRDVRGIKRGHEFDKVEMYKLCLPENSDQELERITRDAAAVCEALGLTYRVMALCGGDLGFAAAKTFDLEVWAPGSGEWLEVSSCSNVRDFQARRANIRFRRAQGERPEFVHTLNGSGLALPRVMIAILENYQQPDGSVVVPEVLRARMGGLHRIAAPA